MTLTAILVMLGIGLVAGWLASFIVGGHGLVTYLISGVVGAFVGPVLLSLLGIDLSIGGPLITQILVSAIGAIVVVLVARLVAR
ncbi:GlsB/YeaQ/YmgE family stress response membrane protein [Chachezhania antarctica]|uniref:GlsB/YeaQ/YmgE family stress response membrane protein n=1 Tax=Chachezhania antarctica TaxID=2340860 RepID=UPI000EB0C65D|nr:GlsB/YeaQ/YmgE family stress response membrane protein [Chachezhania antarctica]